MLGKIKVKTDNMTILKTTELLEYAKVRNYGAII